MSPGEKRRFSSLVKINLAALVGLAVAALFLPLSGTERGVLLLSIAVLLGFSAALLERLRG